MGVRQHAPQEQPGVRLDRNTGQLRITRRAVPPWAAERADTIVDFRHSGWDERSERAA
jgi:hypothetical protein